MRYLTISLILLGFLSISYTPISAGSDSPKDESIRTFQGHTEAVRGVVFSPDGKIVASESDDKTIKLWSTSSGELINTFEDAFSPAFSSDGKTVVFRSGDQIKFWSVETGELKNIIETIPKGFRAISHDLKLLALGGSIDDDTVKIWDTKTNTLKYDLKGHSYGVHSFAFSPDDRILATGDGAYGINLKGGAKGLHSECKGDKTTVKIWDLKTGKLIHRISDNCASFSLDFSSDGKLLASGSIDKTIDIWNVKTGKLVRTINGNEYCTILSSEGIHSVDFSPNSKTIASGSWDENVMLWSPSTGKLIRTLKGHSSNVVAVAFSPDGKLLASGSLDNTIKLWKVSK